MGRSKQMSDKSYPTSFRLNETAYLRLESFCHLTGMRKSEVVKAALAQFIAPTLGNTNVQTAVTHYNPKNETRCATSDKKSDVQAWFKAFWVICEDKQFPERVVRTIGDKWDIIKEKDPEACGEKYNDYCNTEAMRGREYKHPNSWLNDGGYDNETKTDNGGLAYDVE